MTESGAGISQKVYFFLRTALISGARYALGNQIVLYSEGAGPDNFMRSLLVLAEAV